MATATELLAIQIENLRRQMLGSRTPSLPNSSIDDGALTVTQNDGSGNQQVTAIIGQQYDGTSGAVVVAGPTPPAPTAPTLISFIGGVKVRWDGHFADPQAGFSSPVVAPMDFAGVDVHVSDDPSFPEVGFGTNHGTIVSAAGGEVFVPWPVSGTQLYARLVTRSKPGKFSNPGVSAGPTPSGLVQLGDIGFNIAQYAGGNTIYFTVSPATPSAPSWGFTAGDLWLDQTSTSTGANGNPPAGTPLYQTYRWLGSQWVLLQDQGISNSLASAITAQQMANAKTTTFTQPTIPTWSGPAGSAVWIDTSALGANVHRIWNGEAWLTYQLGNGAIQPNSLTASNVIATGTITAALLEANMVLANTLIAGNVNGDHATMQPDGFHVFQTATGAQGPAEVIRLGTGRNNYFGIVDSAGSVVGSWDSTGHLNGSGANFQNDISVAGSPILQQLAAATNSGAGNPHVPGGVTSVGFAPATGSGITAEVGLIEVAVNVRNDRTYKIGYEFSAVRNTDTEIRARIRDGGNGAPNLSSPLIMYRQMSDSQALYSASFQRFGIWQPTTTGTHRLLLSVGTQDASHTMAVDTVSSYAAIYCEDMGPSFNTGNAQINNITGAGTGGATTVPPQQYYTGDLAPSSWATYTGGGAGRGDTNGDIVQGWDPSGYNGDGYGFIGFNLPSITGTINRIDLALVWDWTYFDSGGTLLITPLHSGAASPYSSFQGLMMKGQWALPIGGKSGSGTVTLPSDWFPLFANASSPRASFIGFGASGGTNETYYVKVVANSCRLRIWYNQ
jgi:hypothetical protein